MTDRHLELGEVISMGAAALLAAARDTPSRVPSATLCEHDVQYRHGCIYGCQAPIPPEREYR